MIHRGDSLGVGGFVKDCSSDTREVDIDLLRCPDSAEQKLHSLVLQSGPGSPLFKTEVKLAFFSFSDTLCNTTCNQTVNQFSNKSGSPGLEYNI